MSYKLRSILCGHKSDVLGLAVTQNDSILSCSRDKTAKLWRTEKLTGKYLEAETYLGEQHLSSKFITCICVIHPNDEFQHGLVLTGGNDNLILVFEPHSSIPLQQLSGHTNTVCKLVNSIKTNVVLSASWDTTVKMWTISEPESKCILTIELNQISIWAVLHMKRDLIVTGSADKLIRLFNGDGDLVNTLTGHEDCVRDLAEVDDNEILSCSNDTTIRRWSVVTGECLEVMYGHPNYIYCIRIFGNIIVSGGEDRCLLLWSQGQHLQTITLPARSIWAVELLSNNDIVTGCNDGVIRIFTCDERRQADEETLDAFAKECASFSVPFKKYMGRSKVSRLPGPEILREPGIKEGQTKIVRENEKVICYSWSLAEKMWKKLGNVDAAGPPNKPAKSTIHTSVDANVKKISLDLKEQKEPFVCAICRKTFTRKYVLRKHFRKNNHSIANQIPPYLQSVLPRRWHYYVSTFRRRGTRFKAELSLSTVNNVDDLHEWIRTFSETNKCVYRRNSTKRSTRGLTAYSEFYRCQHAYVSKKSKKKRSKGTGCKSTIHVAIRRDICGIPCYSKVNINFVHNHSSGQPSQEVKDRFRHMFENGFSPVGALRVYRKQLELQSSEAYERLVGDRSVCPELSWVQRFYYKVCGGVRVPECVDASEDGVGVSQTEMVAGSVYVDHVEQVEISSEGVPIESTCAVGESSERVACVDCVDDIVVEVEVGPVSEDEAAADGRALDELEKDFDEFARSLDSNWWYYETGVMSMQAELMKACNASAVARRSALYSFGGNRRNRAEY